LISRGFVNEISPLRFIRAFDFGARAARLRRPEISADCFTTLHMFRSLRRRADSATLFRATMTTRRLILPAAATILFEHESGRGRVLREATNYYFYCIFDKLRSNAITSASSVYHATVLLLYLFRHGYFP